MHYQHFDGKKNCKKLISLGTCNKARWIKVLQDERVPEIVWCSTKRQDDKGY